jgi:hypothetical protein
MPTPTMTRPTVTVQCGRCGHAHPLEELAGILADVSDGPAAADCPTCDAQTDVVIIRTEESNMPAQPSELDRLPAGAAYHLRYHARQVDAADAELTAAGGTIDDGLHDDYAHACHALAEAVRNEAAMIRRAVADGHAYTDNPPPASALVIADRLEDYADELEDRRGMI